MLDQYQDWCWGKNQGGGGNRMLYAISLTMVTQDA